MRVIILPLLDNYFLTYSSYLIYKNHHELTKKSVNFKKLRVILSLLFSSLDFGCDESQLVSLL